MEVIDAPLAFATLGHPGRLAVFRLLMRHAPHGVRPSEVAAALAMKPNTLSHHLSGLEAAGLILGAREGRSILYRVRLEETAALVGYLAQNVGRGRADVMAPLGQDAQGHMQPPFRVLFLCSGNSARSIFAEALLADIGKGRFVAYSAGTRPGTEVNAYAIEVLRRAGLPTAGLRSKHMSDFEGPDAPQMDFVFTVCDSAASEECAPWPGQPMTAHWGLPDPVRATGTDAERALAFVRAFEDLRRRIAAFAALPIAELSRLALQHRIDEIGEPR